MMSVSKKKILISKELLKTSVGSFFQVSGLECVTEYKVEDKEDLEFIINEKKAIEDFYDDTIDQIHTRPEEDPVTPDMIAKALKKLIETHKEDPT